MRETRQDIDEGDDDTGDGVAANELVRAIHGAVILRLAADLQPPLPGFDLVDQAGIQIGVDAHLFAGHGIQGETGGHFGDAAGTFGDYHEIDHHEDHENDHPDQVVASDDEVAEGHDHLAGGMGSLVSVQQDDPRGGHIQGKPKQRDHQQK